MGRVVRPPDLSRDARGHRHGAGTDVHRPRSDADRRHPRRSAAPAARHRPQRADDVRALGHRHRPLGHRGQGRGAAALPAARRGDARRPARVREPAALRPGRRRGLLHRAGAQARLSRHQAARDHGARGEGGARRGRRRRADHARHQLSVDGRAGDRDGAAAGAARPALAGGAGVPARERRGPRRGAAARRHPHGGRRELWHRLGLPPGLRGGRHRLCPAERDQDRRRDRAAARGRPRRDVRRHRRPALGVLRSRPARLDPLYRRDAR